MGGSEGGLSLWHTLSVFGRIPFAFSNTGNCEMEMYTLGEVMTFAPECRRYNSFYRTQVNLGSDLWVQLSMSPPERFVRLY